ncbi:hypothetical protein AAG906_005964 [Vitis piasezkii]
MTSCSSLLIQTTRHLRVCISYFILLMILGITMKICFTQSHSCYAAISCINGLDIVQHGPPLFWTKDLFSGPLFVMLFILHFKWKICVKSNSHFAVEEADVYSFGIAKEECIYRLDWVISTTFFIVFVISEFSHSYPSRLIA